MKNLLLVLAGTTRKGTQYAIYLSDKDGVSLIAPCTDEKEAKAIGMNYNSAKSSLPPYTVTVSDWSPKVFVQSALLKNILIKSGISGKIAVYRLHGFNTECDGVLTIKTHKT